MAKSITNWMVGLGQGQHTDDNNFGGTNQNYVSAESIVVAVRPLIFSTDLNGNDILIPDSVNAGSPLNDPGNILNYVAIGTVQNISISQQRPSTQLWELGSRFSYFIPGKNMIQANLSKVILNGDSLLKTLYPASADATDAVDINDALAGVGLGKLTGAGVGSPGGKYSQTTGSSAYFFSNLASELFNMPMDIMLMILDSEGIPVHGMILKQSYVQAHQMGAAAQQLVMVENAVIRCVRILPVATA